VTAFQIHLQMLHRLLALMIVGGVMAHAWSLWRRRRDHPAAGTLGAVWAGLLLIQFGLGAATIWTNKAADVATAHVAVGALSLSCGAVLGMVLLRLRREQVPEVGPCRAANEFLQPAAAPVAAPGASSR
jgi:cytochrome c oxidase assembly protein subunit 15